MLRALRLNFLHGDFACVLGRLHRSGVFEMEISEFLAFSVYLRSDRIGFVHLAHGIFVAWAGKTFGSSPDFAIRTALRASANSSGNLAFNTTGSKL